MCTTCVEHKGTWRDYLRQPNYDEGFGGTKVLKECPSTQNFNFPPFLYSCQGVVPMPFCPGLGSRAVRFMIIDCMPMIFGFLWSSLQGASSKGALIKNNLGG